MTDRAEKLKNALLPWMRTPTWYTSHPLDEARFTQAVQNAVETVGTDISIGEFEHAIEELAKKSITIWPVKDLPGTVRRFAHRAVMLSGRAASRI